MKLPPRVKIVEVGPRDGLQNEAKAVPAEIRIELIERLAAAGITAVEAGSFVSARWVPQMADTAAVLAGIRRQADTRYPVLTPNLTGLERALEAGADEVAVFAAASETFSQRNLNRSIQDSLRQYGDVCRAAGERGVPVRGYVSCVLGCPYEGEISPAAVADVAKRLKEFGCYEVSLGDTIGVGTPVRAQELIEVVAAAIGREALAVHFHDTYGQGLANILAALQCGVAVIDSSVAGLGGCPYAKGASGNVATEDVLFMLEGLRIDTGVDLQAVFAAGTFICSALGRSPLSKVAQAMAARMAS